MKIVVGLGNPGLKYHGTRHNVGFEVISELATRFQAGAPQNRFQSEIQDVTIGSEKTLLVAPLTFMNLSGQAVQQVFRFYQIDLSDVAVICDDMNLPTGQIRWRKSGSAGGQNGLKDIIQRVGTEDFPRLRIGIDRPTGQRDATSWVLGKFSSAEREIIDLTIARAADSVEVFVRDGIEAAMSRFNGAPPS